jgi:hypothetical protein
MITGRWSWIPALATLGRETIGVARRINLWLWEMSAGSILLLPACSLQGGNLNVGPKHGV